MLLYCRPVLSKGRHHSCRGCCSRRALSPELLVLLLVKHLQLLQLPAAAAVVCVLLGSSAVAVLPISTALGAECDLVCQGREVAWPPVSW